jgi:cytoskeletal protein RodZ
MYRLSNMEKHSSNLVSKSLGSLFKRFHLMIFFVFVASCLALTVVMVTQILSNETAVQNEALPSATPAAPADTSVLSQIEALHTSDAAPTPVLPEGRINPFAE